MTRLPAVLRHRDFNLYWFGVVLSQLGSRGTSAACLYHVYQLSDSISVTGLVGLAQGVALVLLSPLGGVFADRLDRRHLLQVSQAVSLLGALALTVLTFSDVVRVWHILACVLLVTAASTFDKAARIALIPALVPRAELPQAIALVNPSRELAVLVGPALAGLLIAVGSPGLMYALDVATYAVLIGALQLIRAPAPAAPERTESILASMHEGGAYLRRRPLILQLIGLDLSATVFGAYRVVLPALAVDVFHVGATGYGILAAAPSAGALLAAWTVFRVVTRRHRLGLIVLWSTMGYGAAVIVLGQAPVFGLALAAGLLLGACDALATTIRHAAVQLDTPDQLRGRVSSLYQMASSGGPAIGQVAMGAAAGLVGTSLALTVGGGLAILYGAWLLGHPSRVSQYVRESHADARSSSSAPPGA